jgi:hypothetical protein
MNKILYVLLVTLTLTGFTYSQKYVLLDKQMTQAVSYTDKVTMEHSYRNLFPVEKDKIHQFIAEVEKIGSQLNNPHKPLPETFDYNVGKTRFIGMKVGLAKENRMDIVLTTDCDGIKVPMHLSDAKISNANNAFFINTWVKYIKGSIK